MAQRLRAPTALSEVRGSTPIPTWWLTTVCNSSSRAPNPMAMTLMHINKQQMKYKIN